MLGCGHEQLLMAELWELTETKVQIPAALASGFTDLRGPTSRFYDDKRDFHRFFLRGKAVVKRNGKKLGAYTKDVSRSGVGFLSPVQLMPKERVCLTLATAELTLEVSRCQRVEQACFDCGGRFVLGEPIATQ